MENRFGSSLRLIFVVLVGLVCASGCCSTRFTTTISKIEDAANKFPVRFRIESARPPKPIKMMMSTTGYAWGEQVGFGPPMPQTAEEFTDKLIIVATDRYPNIFSTSTDALPLKIKIDARHSDTFIGALALELGTLAIMGGILPLPFSATSDFTVRTSIMDANRQTLKEDTVRFTRKDGTWLSVLTPFGLCPVPGKSDYPKISEVGGMKATKFGGDVTLEGYADAIVKTLNQLDMDQIILAYEKSKRATGYATTSVPQPLIEAALKKYLNEQNQPQPQPPQPQRHVSSTESRDSGFKLREGKRWAVIIGIADYNDSRIPSLRYSARDAKIFYEWMTSPEGGRYAPSRVKLLLNDEALNANIKNALFVWLGQALEEDVVTIYFAGHGSPQSPDNTNNLFFLPHDADYSNIATTGFPMWDIETALKRFIKAKKVIIIADACHSGGVGHSFDIARRGNRGIKVNPISSALQSLSKIGDGVCVITASDDRQFSQEGQQWGNGHGVFTYFLLEGLKGEADYGKDGNVTLGELIPYLSEQVRRATRSAQCPTVAGRFDPALTIGR